MGRATVRFLEFCVVVLVAASTPAATAAADSSVTIIDFALKPATLTVSPGTTVSWTNSGAAPHTSTSDSGVWDSARLDNGGAFSFQFATAGRFAYHCAIHPSMHGVIVVAEAGQMAAEPTATDGKRLSGETAATQMMFVGTWGDQAPSEWVREHNAALAGQPVGPAPSAPAPAPAPAAPAPEPAPAPGPGY